MIFSIRTYGFHTFPIAPINNQSVSGRASNFFQEIKMPHVSFQKFYLVSSKYPLLFDVKDE